MTEQQISNTPNVTQRCSGGWAGWMFQTGQDNIGVTAIPGLG